MTQATYKRENLIGAFLTDSESMMIMAGSMTAGKQAWHWSKSREITSYPQVRSREGKTGPALEAFEISKPTPGDTPSHLPRRPHLLIFPNIVPALGFKYMSLRGPCSFTPPTEILLSNLFSV